MVLTGLRDARGGAVALGTEIAKGGEGAIFVVQDQAATAAKVYFKPISRDHADKLAAMVARAEPRVINLGAWPTSTLHDRSGATIGFLMPKLEGYQDVFQLYGPKLRLRQFPRADWRFLIAAAANTARAFSVVHQAGQVIGDVNHGNLAISQDATVRLYDCDSFQIVDGSRRWFCEVGVGTHQPPEMQGLASYKGILRTANQDNFGLAVLIFQLLCMGRHPFSGRSLGAGDPPSIEEAIEGFRYAFSRDQNRTRMAPPPGSLAIDALGSTLPGMFELAFSSTVTRGGRPSADQWVHALQALSGNLRKCPGNDGHWYLSGLTSCPWCDLEAKSGVALFSPGVVKTTVGSLSIAALWQQVIAVADPGPLPPITRPQNIAATASSEARAAGIRGWRRQLIAGAVGLVLTFIIFGLLTPSYRVVPLLMMATAALFVFYFRLDRAAQLFRSHAESLRREWQDLEAAWNGPPSGRSFIEIRKSLDILKQQHDGLPAERARRFQKLWEARQQAQLLEHLDRFQIAVAKISTIGKAKVATLHAHGIFTAGDVDPVRLSSQVIPGFGPATKGKLLDWRQDCERRFRFDANRGVSPADQNALDQDIQRRAKRLEQDVLAGLGQLRTVVADIDHRRRKLEGQVRELLPKLAQANADARAARV